MIKRLGFLKYILLFILLLAVMIFSASVGSSDITISDSLRLVIAKIPLLGSHINVSDLASTYDVIVWKIRLPRICLSALVGAALAMSGCAYQGVFKNPLSDPYVLGASSGAALFATISVVLGFSVHIFGLGSTGLMAFLGAILTVFVVYYVSQIGGKVSMTNMLLTGTAIGTMLSAFISLILLFNHEQIDKIYMWTMGSFNSSTWNKAALMAVSLLVCSIVLMILAPKINILMLDDEDAKGLGMDTKRMSVALILTASLLTAVSVSVSGIIGFVGLIIPHSVRLIGGSDNRRVMPLSALVGAVFLVSCDTIARTIAAPTEIPIGIITAICGGPYFIGLVYMNKRRKR